MKPNLFSVLGTRYWVLALLLLLLAPAATAQAIPGIGTRVANGATLPANAALYVEFILTTGTPTLYICNANPCMVSGDWVASGGGGGGGGGANTALSNLSGVAINTTLISATGVNMTVSGFNGTGGASPMPATLEGGQSYAGSSQTGGAAFVFGGNGANSTGGAVTVQGGGANTNYPGGAVYVEGGPAAGNSGAVGGSVNIIAANGGSASGGGAGGILLLQAGKNGAGGNTGNGIVSVAGGGAAAVNSYAANISGYVPAIYFLAGSSTAGAAEIDFVSGSPNPGVVYFGNMALAFQNGQDFDLSAHAPNNAYFNQTVYAKSFVATGSGSPVAQGTSALNAQGIYAGTPTSQSGQQTLSFIAGGGVGYSFNGGGAYTLANLTSNISGNAGTATAFAVTPTQCNSNQVMTGLQANGNANCATANVITLQEVADQTSASGYLTIWGGNSTHGPRYSENGGPATALGSYPNLFNTALGGASNSTLEEQSGTTPQSLYVYQTNDGANPYVNYSRMGLYYDGSGSFVVSSESGGSGTTHNLAFRTGSSMKWEITTTTSPNQFRPVSDDAYDLGDATHRVHNLYLGSTVGASLPLCTNGSKQVTTTGCASPGTGTVTSVTFTGDGIVDSATPSTAVTGSGTVLATVIQQSANKVLAGPTSGGAANPSFRSLVGADLPNPAASTLGGIESLASASHQWINQISTSGVPSATQPAFTDISGSVAASQLPNPSASTLGGIESIVSASHNWVAYIDTSGVPHQSQPAFSDLSGSLNTEWLTNVRGSGTASFSAVANKARLWGVVLHFPVTTTQVTYGVNVADTNGAGSCNYDIGIYNSSGTLKLNLGSTANNTFAGSTGAKTVSWTQGSTTLQPGRYYLALATTCTANLATIQSDASTATTFWSGNSTDTTDTWSSGLNSSITAPTDTYSYGANIPAWFVR